VAVVVDHGIIVEHNQAALVVALEQAVTEPVKTIIVGARLAATAQAVKATAVDQAFVTISRVIILTLQVAEVVQADLVGLDLTTPMTDIQHTAAPELQVIF
jgi:hypothetical protein